jgi:hypothetical protein
LGREKEAKNLFQDGVREFDLSQQRRLGVAQPGAKSTRPSETSWLKSLMMTGANKPSSTTKEKAKETKNKKRKIKKLFFHSFFFFFIYIYKRVCALREEGQKSRPK